MPAKKSYKKRKSISLLNNIPVLVGLILAGLVLLALLFNMFILNPMGIGLETFYVGNNEGRMEQTNEVKGDTVSNTDETVVTSEPTCKALSYFKGSTECKGQTGDNYIYKSYYRYMEYKCLGSDKLYKEGSESSCKSEQDWRSYAESFCKKINPTCATTAPTPVEEQLLCKNNGVDWKQFGNSCADKCRPAGIMCSSVLTMGCDCGTEKCWNGNTCVSNPYSSPKPTPINDRKQACDYLNKYHCLSANTSNTKLCSYIQLICREYLPKIKNL